MLKMIAGSSLLLLLGGCASTKWATDQQRATRSAQMQVVPLKHAVAAEVAGELNELQGGMRCVADPRTNSLIVSAGTGAELARVLEVVAHLDTDCKTFLKP